MDQFHKVRKKMSIAESTRQVLNKSIDLLHKLSNKKLSKEELKRQLAELLSNYFFTYTSPTDEASKLQWELFLEQAYEIVEKVANGKAPLYEAIMLMNKVVVAHQPSVADEREVEEKPPVNRLQQEDEPGLVTNEFDMSGDVRDKIKTRAVARPVQQDVGLLISDVLKRQEELTQSIFLLNDSLKAAGFELRPIPK